MNKLFCVIILCFFTLPVQARDKFNVGSEIHVISDKAFRISEGNLFEAMGNVIIRFGNNSIYGEKAKIHFESGDIEVEGNVRYISNDVTMYGTKLFYNTKTRVVNIHNARVLSDNFVILGKELTKLSDNHIIGKDAEYSTCKDCPESWSIYGKDIDVTVGKYVTIKHAFIKMKGVVFMYFPYIVFPIKNDRESGLLFPQISFNFADGVKFQQPFFWAINSKQDMTLTPSLWGKRGLGGEVEYRHFISDRKWFQMKSLFADDEVYEQYKSDYSLSGNTEFRHYSDFELQFSHGVNFNHHLYVDVVNDLDMIRDFDFYTSQRMLEGDLGAEGFFDFRLPRMNLAIDSSYKRNILFDKEKEFDKNYVQIIPRISLFTTPLNLMNTDYFGMNSFSVGLEADYTEFKQRRVNEAAYIRNAQRTNLNPYFNWNLGNIGGVNLNNYTTFDYQSYKLPTKENTTYYKHAAIHKTTAKIEFEKIFGVAFREDIPEKDIPEIIVDKKKEQSRFIGDLPTFEKGNKLKMVEVFKNSYRHSQIFELNHYLLSNQGHGGDNNFHEQIQNEAGQFDYIDALREKDFETSEADAQTTLPLRNTIELQWNNSLIEKRAYKFNFNEDNRFLKQNFSYSKIAYFNLSQGYNLDTSSEKLREKLTRLYMTGGLSIDNFSLSASEFYFYNVQKHVFSVNLTRKVKFGHVSTGFTYDSRSTPFKKILQISGDLTLLNLARLYVSYDYDIAADVNTRSLYGIEYTPYNDCWTTDLRYTQDLIEDRISFNFILKFNDTNFKSF